MFDQTFVGEGGARFKPWTIAASLALQCFLVSIGILIPLVYTYELPVDEWMRTARLLVPPPPPPPSAPSAPKTITTKQEPTRFEPVLRAPTLIPEEVAIVEDSGARSALAAVGAPSVGGGVVGGVPGGLPALTQPVVFDVSRPKPVRVGGSVQAAKIVNRVLPQYPPEASEEGISGVVRLEAVITADGVIRELRVLDGNPLLVASAVAAVQQWRYRPTLLNGVPVEVVTYIDIVFKAAPREKQDEDKKKGRKKRQSR
jgi:protein TonB